MWLALLQYWLYCHGLEPNPKYIQGLPIFLFIKLVSPRSQSPNKSGLNSALSDFRSITLTLLVVLPGFLRCPREGLHLGNLGFLPPWCQHLFPRKLHFLSSYACVGLRAGSFSPLHFISKSKPYNKFTSEEICLFSKGQTHMLSKKCKLKQVPFFTYEIDKNESNYIAIIGKGVVKIGTSHRWEDN